MSAKLNLDRTAASVQRLDVFPGFIGRVPRFSDQTASCNLYPFQTKRA